MNNKTILSAMIFLLLSSAAGTAGANLRAPKVIDPGPSAALEAPSVGPTVKGEQLTIDCEGPGMPCRVVARYDLVVDEPMTITTAFIVPSDVDVAVSVAGNCCAVTKPASTSRPPSSARIRAQPVCNRACEKTRTGTPRAVPVESRYELRRKDQVVSIPFSAALPAGDVAIEVTYEQPVTRVEVGHSYFSDGRMVDSLGYELWPLAAWDRASDFALTWSVSMHRPEPSWWASTFGTVRSFSCRGDSTKLASPKQVGDRIVARGTWGNDFPERLMCTFDEDDKL